VDESPAGRTAARLAGLLAGAQGMPVTILKLDTDPGAAGEANAGKDEKAGEGGARELESDPLAREVKAGARKSAAKMIADDAEPDPEKVHLTARVPLDSPAEMVRDEARKGYDLMFLGLENSVDKEGGFTPKVTELAAGFEGPLAVFADSRDGERLGREEPLNSRSRLLVPVNGTPQSRRAAEIACALGRATGAKVHVLFVSQAEGHSRTRLREERVLKDMVDLGERYNVAVSTHISARSAAAAAILTEARRNYAMIVMGVSARPGEELFFGNTATAVLKAWENPVLMVAS
jgi:nucleotide-binding universal stress UspA family protein